MGSPVPAPRVLLCLPVGWVWLAGGPVGVGWAARCSQRFLRYERRLCSLALHAAPQTAAASSGPLSPPAPCCLAVVRGSCWLAVGLWEVRSSARCSQWPPRYERRLCLLALHAAPQTAAASSGLSPWRGPSVPLCAAAGWAIGGRPPWVVGAASVCCLLPMALRYIADRAGPSPLCQLRCRATAAVGLPCLSPWQCAWPVGPSARSRPSARRPL